MKFIKPLQRQDSNLRPSAYETDEMPTSLLRANDYKYSLAHLNACVKSLILILCFLFFIIYVVL